MRFREDKSTDLQRARAAVAEWREQNPEGTEDQLTDALGAQFHPDYGPVLRAVLYAFDRDHTGNTEPAEPVNTGGVFTGSASVPSGALAELEALRAVLPGYDVTISSRSPTPAHRFEAIRCHDGTGPWCVVSSDPADLWRELAGRTRPAALDGDSLDRALLMARLTISASPRERIPRLPERRPRS